MKIVTMIFLLLLTACRTKLPMSDDQIGKLFPPSMDAFKFSDSCPHICWLGINPGSTTADAAEAILKASNQIDPKSLQVSDASIIAVWFAGRLSTYPCNVNLQLEKGLVKSIAFDRLPFTMNDFVRLVGEPNEIRIELMTGPDQIYIQYWTYYVGEKILITVSPGNRNGPDPSDVVDHLFLNQELSRGVLQGGKEEIIQPWLGYHHIQEYLPGIVVPPANNPTGP